MSTRPLDDGGHEETGNTPHNMTDDHMKVSTLLQQDCELMREEHRKKDKKADIQQVFGIACFKEEDIQNLILLPEERVKIYFNEPVKSYHGYEFKNKTHGEIIAIVVDDIVETLMKEVNKHGQKSKENILHVYIYSNYIPCAGIQYGEYSCAEEILKLALFNCGKLKIHVGYSNIFTDTKLEKAFEFLLSSDNIAVYSLLTGNEFKGWQRQKKVKLIQDMMVRHLVDMRPSLSLKIINNEIYLLIRMFLRKYQKCYGYISTLTLNMIGRFIQNEWIPYHRKMGLRKLVNMSYMKLTQEHFPLQQATAALDCTPPPPYQLQFGKPVENNDDIEWRPIEDIHTINWCELEREYYSTLESENPPSKLPSVWKSIAYRGRKCDHPCGDVMNSMTVELDKNDKKTTKTLNRKKNE